MALVCQCPAATALTTIPAMGCGENFGQIQKVAFQRILDDDGDKNVFTSTNDIKTLASWTALLSETDGTKIVVSPFIENPVDEAGSPVTFGGGNETRNGIEIIVGANPTTFSAVMRSVPQNIVKAMKTLMCEAQAGNLGVFLFNGSGQIEAILGGTTQAPTYAPIPIQSLFVGDKVHGGFEQPDSNQLQWSYADNYSDELVIVTPSFDPLTDLVP